MSQKINKISLLIIFFFTCCLSVSFAEDQIYTFKSKNTDFIGSVAKEKNGSRTISHNTTNVGGKILKRLSL